MPSIHLRVMELERYWQQCLKPFLAILTPHHHRIMEFVGVLVYNTIELRLNHCRCPHYHVVWQESALTICRRPVCQCIILGDKLIQIRRERDVTRIDSAFPIIHYHVYGYAVKLKKPAMLRQKIKLLDLGSRFANALA